MLMVKKYDPKCFDRRRTYVEDLNMMLEPLHGFDRIEYARAFMQDKEYVKISDIIGNVLFLDISGLTLSEILKEVAKSILIDEIKDPNIIPDSLVFEREDKLKIAELFV